MTLVRVLALVAAWAAIGFARAPAVATAWLTRSEAAAGESASNVSTEFAAPVMPPLWLVNVSGDITEPGDATPVYRSYRLVLVEPITGIVLELGRG